MSRYSIGHIVNGRIILFNLDSSMDRELRKRWNLKLERSLTLGIPADVLRVNLAKL